MANLRTIQFLRNATNYDTLEAAKTALIAKASELLDGSPVIGRYNYVSGETTVTKTILGIVANGTVSFFLNENEISSILDKLDYSGITTSDAAVVTNVTEENGLVAATSANVGNLKLTDYVKGTDSGTVASNDTINQAIAKVENHIDGNKAAFDEWVDSLDFTLAKDENKALVSISQADGQVSATSENLTTIKLAGYTVGSDNSGKVAATDTLGEALGKLQGQINGMDKSATTVDGQVVITVTEADGVVDETKANVKDLQLGGYSKGAQTGAIESTDTINVALSKIENTIGANKIANADGSINVTTASTGTDINVNIKSGEHVLAKDGNNGLYTNISLSSITPSSTTVKEEYQLTATDGTKLGDTIKIYKDSSIVSINYITDPSDAHYQNLEYVYIDASGNTQTEYVDMSALVIEAEFQSGVTADASGVVHGVVDASSEKVITAYSSTGNTEEDVFTVGEDGFKVANIQKAITAAMGAANVNITLQDDTESATSVAVDEHVTLSSSTADNGKVSYTIHTNDIASKNDLDVEIAARKAVDGQNGQTYVANENVNYIGGATSLNDADIKLDAALKAREDEIVELSGKTITSITSNDSSITATINDAAGNKTVNLSTDGGKIKATGFDDNATSGTPAATDSVSTVLSKLYANAKMDAVKAGSATTVVAAANGTTVDVKLDTTSAKSTFNGNAIETDDGTNALTITNNGLFLSRDWDCGTF